MNGIYAHPDPTKCHLFSTCVDGAPTEQSCPPGLIWSEKTGACSWPSESGRDNSVCKREESKSPSLQQRIQIWWGSLRKILMCSHEKWRKSRLVPSFWRRFVLRSVARTGGRFRVSAGRQSGRAHSPREPASVRHVLLVPERHRAAHPGLRQGFGFRLQRRHQTVRGSVQFAQRSRLVRGRPAPLSSIGPCWFFSPVFSQLPARRRIRVSENATLPYLTRMRMRKQNTIVLDKKNSISGCPLFSVVLVSMDRGDYYDGGDIFRSTQLERETRNESSQWPKLNLHNKMKTIFTRHWLGLFGRRGKEVKKNTLSPFHHSSWTK